MLSACAVVLLAAATACAAAFAPVGAARQVIGAPFVYEWRYNAKVGATAYDRVGLHRVAKGPQAAQHPKVVVLYLPGTNMNGEIAVEDPHYSFPVYLAVHGVDVWTLDYRTHFVPPTLEAKDVAPVMKGWTNEVFAADIEQAARFVMQQTGQAKIYVAGFSRGVTFAYLFAALHPEQTAGVVALDGFIPTHPTAAVPPDRLVDDIGGVHLTYDKRRFLMQAVIDNPDGPAPIPKYKTAGENLEHVVYDSKDFGGKGGLANPQAGLDNVQVLARVLIGYDRYWPGVQNFENPFTPKLLDTLMKSNIPVLAFSSTNISADWPRDVFESAQSLGGKEVAFYKLRNWGHLDVLCGTKAEQMVYALALDWLTQPAA